MPLLVKSLSEGLHSVDLGIFISIVAFTLFGLFAFNFFNTRLKEEGSSLFADIAATVLCILVSQVLLYFILRAMLC